MLPVEGDQMSILQLCLLLLGLTRQEREERGREMGRERKGGGGIEGGREGGAPVPEFVWQKDCHSLRPCRVGQQVSQGS